MDQLKYFVLWATNQWPAFSASFGEWQTPAMVLASTAIVGALGAYFGAVGAQRSINDRAEIQRRRDLIIAINAAHSLTIVMTNQAAALKKQHHLPMLTRWEASRARILEARQKGTVVEAPIHLESPPPTRFPVTKLEDVVYGKIALNGRPLAALAELAQAEHTLECLIQDHTALRREFESAATPYVVPRYFALDEVYGRDDRFQDLRRGFVEILDDFLFFAGVLGEDLLQTARYVRRTAKWSHRRHLPTVNAPASLIPGNENVIPKHAHHQKWLEAHKLTWPSRWHYFLRWRGTL